MGAKLEAFKDAVEKLRAQERVVIDFERAVEKINSDDRRVFIGSSSVPEGVVTVIAVALERALVDHRHLAAQLEDEIEQRLK